MHPTAMQEQCFEVHVNTKEGETVCVVGNCPELGNWLHKDAVPLTKISEGMQGEVWSTTVALPSHSIIEYRYFVCVIVEPQYSDGRPREFIVRRWETHLKPRQRVVDSKKQISEQFGYSGNVWKVEHGWLTAESVVQLKFYNNPIQIWKRRFADKLFCIRVTPVDLERKDSTTMIDDDDTDENEREPPTWPIVELAVMNTAECEFRMQDQFGRVYFPDEFMIFQAQMIRPYTIAFMVDFYLFDPTHTEDIPPTHVGFCYILPSVLRNTSGTCLVPITGSRQQPIGQLTVEYLVVKPMKYDCDMRVSYAKYWRVGRRPLEVGHRGAGNSYTNPTHCATVRENTVASLKLAGQHGADYVEFDVQLSKDLVPIIYHDFSVCISMKKRKSPQEHDLLEVPVKDLTLSQLQMLKLFHVSQKQSAESKVENVDDDFESDEVAPFPTLQTILEEVPIHVGFNVEIKSAMQRKDASLELHNQLEENMYLDLLLEPLLKSAGNRRIIISCFHPDICTMVRLKQNKYPVLFLTQGQTSKWPPYLDTRTRSIPMAVYFARSANILGIDVHTEDILKDHTLVKMTKDSNLVMFCWGDDNNDRSVMNLLRQLGLDGIIYDRINEHKDHSDNIFMMESKARANLLHSVGYNTEFSTTSDASVPSGSSVSSA